MNIFIVNEDELKIYENYRISITQLNYLNDVSVQEALKIRKKAEKSIAKWANVQTIVSSTDRSFPVVDAFWSVKQLTKLQKFCVNPVKIDEVSSSVIVGFHQKVVSGDPLLEKYRMFLGFVLNNHYSKHVIVC